MSDFISIPGNADVLVGEAVKGINKLADEDVGAPREWYSRGYLPHRDKVHLLQAITFRLADSLPQNKLRQLEEELKHLAEDKREVHRRKQIERWLDAGMGCGALGHPEVARYVQDSLLCFDSKRYRLIAWCIMPNHVHVLIEALAPLASIVQGWKSFTARWILARNGQLDLRIPAPHRLWMREYWDRYMRDEKHLRNVVDYIHQNPVKAGLCVHAAEWPWSSAGKFTGSLGTPTFSSARR